MTGDPKPLNFEDDEDQDEPVDETEDNEEEE